MAETQTSRGVVYNEDTSNTPYITESNQKIEGQEPRLLALTSQGKPAYLNNSELLYKKDITLGSNSTITLGTSDTTLFSVPKREGGTASLKVKLDSNLFKDYTSEFKAVSNNGTPVLRSILKKGNDVVSTEDVTIEGSGSTEVTINSGKLRIKSTNADVSGYVAKTGDTMTGMLTTPSLTISGGRTQGSGDDEGIVVTPYNGGFAALTLGNPEKGSGKYHSTFYYNDTTHKMFWRASLDNTNHDIEHPYKSGTIALTSDIPTVPTKTSQLTNDSGFITSYTDEKVKQVTGTDNKGLEVLLSNNNDNTSSSVKRSSNLAFNPSTGKFTTDIHAPAFYADSDAKLKTNITDVPKASISKIDKVKIHEFDWKDGGKHSVGVIAQDVKESGLDFLVSDRGTLSVDYTSILLLKIASLEEKIKELESKIK